MGTITPRTYRSGQWMVVECRSGVEASDAGWMREILAKVRDSTWAGVVLDLSGQRDMDPSGRRMLANFHKGLTDQGRALEVVADSQVLREELQADGLVAVLQDLSELKRSIHEMAPERLQLLISTGTSISNMLGFRLRCPVCRCDDVKGWLPDPRRHSKGWIHHEVTLQLVPDDPDNSLAPDAYAVAVCPECLFAATRMDWFDSPSARMPATLPDGSVERLSKGFARRRALVQDVVLETPLTVFFGMPRLDRATQVSWALAEESLRSVGRDRASTDGFGISVSILMQAKFAKEGDDLERYYSAAYVWLKQVVDQVGNYAEDRIAEAHVYLISVDLALGRETEATQLFKQALQRWGSDPEMATWMDRARDLMR
jgi:hypothetical protein